MKSGKQRRLEIKAKRAAKAKVRHKRKKTWHANEAIAANKSKLRSASCLPDFPDFYFDKKFHCQDCGKVGIWTPRQQKWWYEEIGGAIETTNSVSRMPLKRKIKEARGTSSASGGFSEKKSERGIKFITRLDSY